MKTLFSRAKMEIKREDVIDIYHDSNGPDQSEFLQHEEPLPEKATTVMYS
jgi:hypothetical protein